MDKKEGKEITRRCFLRQGVVGIGAVTVGGSIVFPQNWPSRAFGFPDIPNATMVVMHNPALCLGCRRCEVACSTMREGAAQPSRSRIFIDRRYQETLWTDGQFVGETCRQCEDAPCLHACPAGAIKVDEKTKARYVDLKACGGLGNCQRACPFGMVNFFEDDRKARKCDLCGGDPACVKQCPTTALRYVKWDPRYDDLG
jgi:Fe-S-cluster-containing hydrogenase component 2